MIYWIGCDIQKAFMVDVAANCQRVLERIREAAAKCGRDPDGIKILAASKSQEASHIRAALAAGIRLFSRLFRLCAEFQQGDAPVVAVAGWTCVLRPLLWPVPCRDRMVEPEDTRPGR